MNCRHCDHPLVHVFLDLGFAPPSNAFLSAEALKTPETYFPLKLYVCDQCWLVQTEDYARAEELFSSDYAYFSSVSQTWLTHAAHYTEAITRRLGLGKNSFVVEVASNDGYLLKNFVQLGIPCLGIEPTASTAQAAEALGIPVLREFFSKAFATKLATQHGKVDLVLGNNVYAHVPDINNFTAGLEAILKDDGVVTLEFPHLQRLIEDNQFDTVYHEHFSYLSLHTVQQIFFRNGLRVWDVEHLETHGGSLRVYGCRKDASHVCTDAVGHVLADEKLAGMQSLALYNSFQLRADKVKNDLLAYFVEQKRLGKTVAAYGAAAKGNTLLNYAGVKHDLLSFVCDAAPSKQGRFMPGSHIPIMPPEALFDKRPDIVVILPWNIKNEVMSLHGYIKEWGGRFVTAVPEIKEQS
jgi:2-polyprenyl-3-methyl-5-hydroxy-6-metoxy-1,4-benzoquinol methylase